MRLGKWLLTLILLPASCGAGDPALKIQSLIDQAMAAPGEFAADALLRISALDRIEEKQRIELLERAFERASEAREPYKRRVAILQPGSRFFKQAYSLDLDSLTLRLRVVDAMLPLDGRKAREWFLQIPAIALPALTCDDFLVPDLDRYYFLLGQVARTYSAAEVERGELFRFLVQHVAGMTSPVQVAPVAGMLASTSLKDTEFQAVVAMFAATLGRLKEDDRSFGASVEADRALAALASACSRRGLPSARLVEAYRQYLVTRMAGPRCSPSPVSDSDRIAYFNTALRTDSVRAIAADEAVPSGIQAAHPPAACRVNACRSLADRYQRLVLGPEGVPNSPGQKAAPEWRTAVSDLLRAMAEWEESPDLPAGEHFRAKSELYGELLGLVPNGDEREAVLRAMLDFVGRSRYESEKPIEWFVPVNTLIGFVALNPQGSGRISGELRTSGNPVISLYSELESVVPRAAERFAPQL
jgi:hypothetical protein